MLRLQAVPSLWCAPITGSAKLGLSPGAPASAKGLWFAILLTVLGGLLSPLGAQSRASLQVAAQVLPAQPSRLALSQALSLASGHPVAAEPALALIRLDAPSPASNRRRAVRRAVVTIAFLRN
jgi:hypothetical protein